MVNMSTHNTYLLDTCICIALIKGKPSIIEQIRNVGVERCKISEITLAELYFGAYKSEKKKHFEDVEVVKALFEQYDITSSLETYGNLRYKLERVGLKTTDMDLLIGATAIHNNLTLVTGNVKHFERMPDLRIENWMD
jgi:tRNA(fMet)-specific endonuclease VapC